MACNPDTTITNSKLADLNTNIDNLNEVVTGTTRETSSQDSSGNTHRTLTGIELDAQDAYRLSSDAPQGNYGIGVVYEESNWTYFYNNEYWGLSDTFDLSKLPYKATEADPNNDTTNLMVRSNASQSYVQQQDLLVEGRIVGGRVYSGSNGSYVQNGDTIPNDPSDPYTHLHIQVNGKSALVSMSPISSGLVSGATDTGAVIGGVTVELFRSIKITSTELLVNSNVKENDIVDVDCYSNIFDNGKATYIISALDAGWGIPLVNGLYANLIGEFSILKFGIVNDDTLDQTDKLKRLTRFVDMNDIYEVDFSGYNILVPNDTAYISSRGTNYRGLNFTKPHKLKNLRLKNPIAADIEVGGYTNGWNQVMFTLEENGEGVIELDNVVFDPYVTGYTLDPTNGQEDGAMCGLGIRPVNGQDDNPTLKRMDYTLVLNGIHFDSAAVSYNIHMGCKFKEVRFNNMTGEHLGLYLNWWANRIIGDKIKSFFRDDLFAASGRTLVTSMIHYEAENSGESDEIELVQISNYECREFTTNNPYIALKVQSIGDNRFRKVNVLNGVGETFFFTAVSGVLDKIDLLEAKSCTIIKPQYPTDVMIIDDCVELDSFASATVIEFGDVTIKNMTVGDAIDKSAEGPKVYGSITLENVELASSINGLIRNQATTVESLKIKGGDLSGSRVIEADVALVVVDDMRINDIDFINAFFHSGSRASTMRFKDIVSDGNNTQFDYFVRTNSLSTCIFNFCVFESAPLIFGTPTIIQNFTSPTVV